MTKKWKLKHKQIWAKINTVRQIEQKHSKNTYHQFSVDPMMSKIFEIFEKAIDP